MKQINLENQKKAFELLSILLKESGYIPATKILESYSDFFDTELQNDKLVQKTLRTLSKILQTDIFESKKGAGFKIKDRYREDLFWIASIITRSLALIDIHSLDYVLEPLVHQLKENSLISVLQCLHAKENKNPISFEYSKYMEETYSPRKMQIYGIAQRDTKFEIIGLDLNKNTVQHFFLSQMRNIKIDFSETLNDPPNNFLSEYYKNTLGNYKSRSTTDVIIRFSPESRVFLFKEYFQKNQQIQKQDDGSFDVHLKAQNEQEVFNIVSKFMNYAELISPIEWRNEYKKNLENQLKKHKKT